MLINGKNLQVPPSPKPLQKQGFKVTERIIQISTLVLVSSPVLVYIMFKLLGD